MWLMIFVYLSVLIYLFIYFSVSLYNTVCLCYSLTPPVCGLRKFNSGKFCSILFIVNLYGFCGSFRV